MKKILHVISIIVRITLISGIILVASPFVLRGLSDLVFQHRVYTAPEVPEKRVAVVFGARVYPDGRLSAMLRDRVQTGIDLYHAGKVDVILMTGNRGEWENEPEAMRQEALAQGVPDEAIVLDYAGARTYDSCYRAKAIFGVTDAILVTQEFHLDRALMLCSGMGIDSVGVAADYQRPTGYSRRSLAFSRTREFPATVLAIWDLITRPEPALGEPTPIFLDAQ